MLAIDSLSVSYQKQRILHDINLHFSSTGFTALVGPNGSGKTTLLHSLAGLLEPDAGTVLLNDVRLSDMSRKAIAQQLAMLPQMSSPPHGLTARELVVQGRFPWQRWWSQWSDKDEKAFQFAVDATGIEKYLDVPIEQLSGGQAQRCWIAMTLAQDTPLVLLDEPTTYLDIAHQVELMQLITTLRDQGKMIIAVLHDLNQAAAFADHLVMLKKGKVYTQGTVDSVFTIENIKAVFNLDTHIIRDSYTDNLMCIPLIDPSKKNDTEQSLSPQKIQRIG